MSENVKIYRKAERNEGKIILKSEFTETITEDELNEKYINTHSQLTDIEDNLNLLKAQINRLSSEVKNDKELQEFAKKLKQIEQLKKLNESIEKAKKWESVLETLQKDIVQLRTIQIELGLNQKPKDSAQSAVETAPK